MALTIEDYPVHIEWPVAWGEMDALQHVNNIWYFRYFESARIAYLERIGFIAYMQMHHIGPILKSASCTYRFPLQYPDLLRIGARVSDLATDRMQMDYAVFSTRHQRIAATGESIIVCYDYTQQQKALLPDIIRQEIIAIEPHLNL